MSNIMKAIKKNLDEMATKGFATKEQVDKILNG